MMGSPDTELGRNSNENYHQVTLTKAFYMAIFELTQRQYDLIMGGNNSNPTFPAVGFSWYTLRGSSVGYFWPKNQQVDDGSLLGRIRLRTNLMVDLPTEAMWEYACRAGTTTALNSGKNLSDVDKCSEVAEVARYQYNHDDGKGNDSYPYRVAVGKYLPNAWGLYDMHGNVSEMCLDYWSDGLGTSEVVDPKGETWANWSYRVIRGGNAQDGSSNVRSARRSSCSPDGTSSTYGCRLCCFVNN